jgi:acetolactate synthase regulatory subunit
MARVTNRWEISCNHTPETIDRIMLPIRKRGLMVVNLNYRTMPESQALCSLEFEAEEADIERIYKNMTRISDIRRVERLA